MRSVNQVLIHGDEGQIYRYAAEVERWPEILPHYHNVQILVPGECSRTVEMRCVRRFGPIAWPCRWKARQELFPEQGLIRYRHLGGPAKGMYVEWRLETQNAGVLTSILHEFSPSVPILGSIYSLVVARLFVQSIAEKTLHTIKALVEGEQ